MRKKILFIFALFFIVLGSSQSILAADKIDRFDIDMKVEKDGKIKVNHKIKYNFQSPRHGIFVNIPKKYSMDWDGVKRNYVFPVSNIRVKDYESDVTSESEGVTIRIGDPDSYVEGIVNYEYSFVINTKDLKLDGKQMLYQNLIGNGWQVQMSNINYNITMPKEFTNQVYVYDRHGNVSNDNFSVTSTSIKGHQSSLNSYEALTVKVDLPNDYFEFFKTEGVQLLANIVAGVVGVLCVIVFLLYGRDPKLIPSIQFKPPKGMSSAQVGYVADGMMQNKDITSLIVYWASKNYLSITEKENGKYTFTKLREPDDTELKIEVAIFKSLFSKEDNVDSDKVPNAYSESIVGLNADMKHHYSREKAIYKTKSTFFQVFFTIITGLAFGLLPAINSYFYSYSFGIAMLALFGFGLISMIILGLTAFVLGRANLRKKSKTTFYLLLILALFAVFSLVYLVINNLLDGMMLNSIVMLVILVVSSLFIAFMDSRTKYGHDLLEEIIGFREFIVHAEKERLEMFVKETPSFFYDILPYAYVLGVSDTWIKNFENIKIEQPTWFYSSSPLTNLYFMNSLNSSIATMNTASIVKATSGSGGTSSGGGGFSGGGFSGGGFGGGGGGSW